MEHHCFSHNSFRLHARSVGRCPVSDSKRPRHARPIPDRRRAAAQCDRSGLCRGPAGRRSERLSCGILLSGGRGVGRRRVPQGHLSAVHHRGGRHGVPVLPRGQLLPQCGGQRVHHLPQGRILSVHRPIGGHALPRGHLRKHHWADALHAVHGRVAVPRAGHVRAAGQVRRRLLCAHGVHPVRIVLGGILLRERGAFDPDRVRNRHVCAGHRLGGVLESQRRLLCRQRDVGAAMQHRLLLVGRDAHSVMHAVPRGRLLPHGGHVELQAVRHPVLLQRDVGRELRGVPCGFDLSHRGPDLPDPVSRGHVQLGESRQLHQDAGRLLQRRRGVVHHSVPPGHLSAQCQRDEHFGVHRMLEWIHLSRRLRRADLLLSGHVLGRHVVLSMRGGLLLPSGHGGAHHMPYRHLHAAHARTRRPAATSARRAPPPPRPARWATTAA